MDSGSIRHNMAHVAVLGMEARNLVDMGADITMVGGVLF